MSFACLLLLAHEGHPEPVEYEPFAPLDAVVETVKVGENVMVLKLKGETIAVASDRRHIEELSATFQKRFDPVGYEWRLGGAHQTEFMAEPNSIKRALMTSPEMVLGRVVGLINQPYGGPEAYHTVALIAVEKSILTEMETVAVKFVQGGFFAETGQLHSLVVTSEPDLTAGMYVLLSLHYDRWLAASYSASSGFEALNARPEPDWYTCGPSFAIDETGKPHILVGGVFSNDSQSIAETTLRAIGLWISQEKEKRGVPR